MIQLYTGTPGSGKTYKMVSDLNDFLKSHADITLISNINNLKLPHIDFEQMVRDWYPDQQVKFPQILEQFFQYENQEKVNENFGGPVVYVLDEVQIYFPRSRTPMPNTEEYLQRHRHLGHHIYMATQATSLINQKIVPLIELEYGAVRRSISFIGEMRYRVKSPSSKDIMKIITVYPKKEIFALYKSFESEEIRKPKKQLLRKVLPLAVFLIVISSLVYNRVFDKEARVARNTAGLQKDAEVTKDDEARIETRLAQSFQAAQRQQQHEMDKLRAQFKQLQEEAERPERVFLAVVQVGDKRLTTCPDTLEVIEVHKVKRKVTCVGNDRLRCYYDRKRGEETVFASEGVSFPHAASNTPGQASHIRPNNQSALSSFGAVSGSNLISGSPRPFAIQQQTNRMQIDGSILGQTPSYEPRVHETGNRYK